MNRFLQIVGQIDSYWQMYTKIVGCPGLDTILLRVLDGKIQGQ